MYIFDYQNFMPVLTLQKEAIFIRFMGAKV